MSIVLKMYAFFLSVHWVRVRQQYNANMSRNSLPIRINQQAARLNKLFESLVNSVIIY